MLGRTEEGAMMTDKKMPNTEKHFHQVKLSPVVWARAEGIRARSGLRSINKLIEKLVNDAHEQGN